MRENDSNFTNDEIYSRDWAASDRHRFLRSCRFRAPCVARRKSPPSSSASAVCGTDVSGGDRRSVKRYLRGRGDLRTAWWIVFSAVYRTAMSARGLEHAMFTFHSFHHRLTLTAAEFVRARKSVERDIESGGVLAALKHYR